MFSVVLSVGFLAARVQSVITSVQLCFWDSEDVTCDNDPWRCLEYCNVTDICPFYTCEGLGDSVGWPQPLDECVLYEAFGMDSMLTCKEDDKTPETCENYDLCRTICANYGECDRNCATVGLSLTDLGYDDCDALYVAAPDGFEGWGSCFFNYTGNYTSIITCNTASPSADDGTEPEPSDESDGTEPEPTDESDGTEPEPTD